MIKPPRQQTLVVKDLLVDNYAQRTYNELNAKKIADNWNDLKIGVFKVSKRGKDSYYVLDGQHRLGALRMNDRGEYVIQALVYEGLTLEEEAFIFLADNAENTKPTPVDVFRLSVVAGDPAAVEISKVLDEHGLRIGYGGNHKVVSSVVTLRWIHQQGGVELLDRVLTIVEQAWPAHREAHDGQLMKGIGHFLVKTRGVDQDVLVKKLGSEGTSTQLVGQARTYRPVTGRALWMEIAHRVVAIYNKGRSTNRVAL